MMSDFRIWSRICHKYRFFLNSKRLCSCVCNGKDKLEEKKFILLRGISTFWRNLLNTREKSALITSLLPWLDIVLLCTDGVRMQWVSWAVRYFDEHEWRAVYCYAGITQNNLCRANRKVTETLWKEMPKVVQLIFYSNLHFFYY